MYILFLNANGTVKAQQKTSATQGGFSGSLNFFDLFGFSVAALGDLDGDGVTDLAVGAINDDDGGTDRGALWVLFLDAPVPAGCAFRNGSGINPIGFGCVKAPCSARTGTPSSPRVRLPS